MKLVIAEKPSVARSIAKVLGAAGRENGCILRRYPAERAERRGSAAIAAVAVLAAVLVGGAVWFFKFRKPGKKDKNKPDPDDYDYAEDEDKESGPEDELEMTDKETESKNEPEAPEGETEREDK